MPRRLSLRREALAELTTDELAGLAAGAIPPPTPVVLTLPLDHCLVARTLDPAGCYGVTLELCAGG